jgi:hypothetical protein
MKYSLIFLLFLSFASVGQDCKTLNDFTTFKGAKFGRPLPDSIKRYCDTKIDSQNDTTFIIWRDDIKKLTSHDKLYRLFLVGDYFEYIAFLIYNKNMYSVSLGKEFDDEDSAYLAADKNPVFYQNVSAELVSLFGKATKKYRKDITFGEAIVELWECDKIKIEFGINIYSGASRYYLTITNINLEKRQKFKNLSE